MARIKGFHHEQQHLSELPPLGENDLFPPRHGALVPSGTVRVVSRVLAEEGTETKMKNLIKIEAAERFTVAGKLFGEVVSMALAAVSVPMGIGLVAWMIYHISTRSPYVG